MKQLIISAEGVESRVAMLEQGKLAELFIERQERRSLVGNIYRGKVENVLAGMDAAFVDIGLEKNGFLYVDEVYLPEESDARPKKITQLLRPGQVIDVQVIKDPMGAKGARLTTQLSIAGRYLVYLPEGTICGVSRRLPDAERLRLRNLCREIKPPGAGVIIRTVAEGVSEKAITRDLRFLEKLWSTVTRRLETIEAPAMVYSEAELPLKIVRDLFNEDFTQILVDDEPLLKKINGFLQATTPELADRLELYRGSKPLFETYGLELEIEKGLERRVDLPSGGYLVIDDTEAMTVVDVNTGRYVGRKFLEDTILKTNLEACREVVRQMRIRDIGGIIIIDFIDMSRRENREQVLATLEAELAKDRTKTYVVELSPLGLVEMTRQNLTDGIRGIMTTTCPTCRGEGVVLSAETLVLATERRLRRLAESSQAEAFLIEVHPRVAQVLLQNGRARLAALEAETGKILVVEGVPHLPEDGFEMAAEGAREVITRAGLPVSAGQVIEVTIDEVHAYNRRDGIAHVDGLAVCVAGAADAVGQTVRVAVDEVTRACAYAHLSE
ncbi:MAG: Rne/Rng family ribonuclease [Thermoleophilia bacterium]|nr:Rne/Rng family ribonuclease [Thermoleophilia bacterium]